MLSRIARFLTTPRGAWVIFAAALVLGLSTCAIGFYSDDWSLIAVIEGRARTSGSAFDLYRFASGDAAQNAAFIESGPWPWWTHPEIKIQLMRPLASALFTLDHALFGHAPLGYHLHTLAWWLALVAAARGVLRRAVPSTAAAIALLLFALDDAHLQTFGWISCRHMVVAAAPALFGVYLHLYGRGHAPFAEGSASRSPRAERAARLLAPLFVAIGLLGSEAALGALGYWVAFELTGARDDRRTRLRAAAPAILLGVAYVAAYKGLGYGASKSGMYIEPFGAPLDFLAAAAVRIPILVGDLLLSAPADFSNVMPPAPLVVVGLVAATVVGLLLRHVWPILSADERASVRWLGLGAFMGILVGLAGFPGSRVLLLPSVGGFGILAMVIDKILISGQPAPRRARAGATLLAIVHGVLAPLMFAVQLTVLSQSARKTEAVHASLVLEPPVPKRVYILAASDPLGPAYAYSVRAVLGPHDADVWAILSMAKLTHVVRRTGPRTLRLETQGGTFYDGGFVHVYRSRGLPLPAGTTVKLAGGAVRVLADRGGAPTSIELTLDVPFEDPGVAILAWQDEALRPIALEVDKPVRIDWSPGPTGFF